MLGHKQCQVALSLTCLDFALVHTVACRVVYVLFPYAMSCIVHRILHAPTAVTHD